MALDQPGSDIPCFGLDAAQMTSASPSHHREAALPFPQAEQRWGPLIGFPCAPAPWMKDQGSSEEEGDQTAAACPEHVPCRSSPT